MRQFIHALAIAMAVCAFRTAFAADISSHALLNGILVESNATRIEGLANGYLASFQVTHVFFGDTALVGASFQVRIAKGFSTGGVPLFVPPLKLGDRLIWLLTRENGALTYVPFGPSMRRSAYGGVIGLPARQGEKNVPNPYEEAREWATAVEHTVKAEPAARQRLLKEFAQSNSRAVVEWALGVLAEADPRGSPDFFRRLIAREDIKVWQKVLAERTLANLAEAGWKASPERLRVYQSWAREPITDMDANQMQRSLALMLQQPDFPMGDFLNLLKRIVEEKEFSAKTRASAVDSFRYFSREPTLRLPAFEFLLALVTPVEQFEVQLAAARNIRHFFPKEAQSRRKDVETARGAVKDKTVSNLLEEALRSHQTAFDRLDEAFRSHLKEP